MAKSFTRNLSKPVEKIGRPKSIPGKNRAAYNPVEKNLVVGNLSKKIGLKKTIWAAENPL